MSDTENWFTCKKCGARVYKYMLQGCTNCSGRMPVNRLKSDDEIERLRKSNTELQQAINSTAKIVEGIRNWQVNVDMANEIERLTARVDELEKGMPEFARKCATDFYYWWHNQPGTNTQQGFQDWWELNKDQFLSTKQGGEG